MEIRLRIDDKHYPLIAFFAKQEGLSVSDFFLLAGETSIACSINIINFSEIETSRDPVKLPKKLIPIAKSLCKKWE